MDIQIIYIMKKTFFITTNLIYRGIWIFGVLFFITACGNRQAKPAPELAFDLDTPGGKVVASFEDDTPQVVFFYKVDEDGEQTHEQVGIAEYYPNKQERLGGAMKNGKREGQWYAFFPDGSVQTEAYYVDGLEQGDYIVYRSNGNPIFKGHYDLGICDGIWYWYDETGKQIRKVKATQNTVACEYCKKCLSLK